MNRFNLVDVLFGALVAAFIFAATLSFMDPASAHNVTTTPLNFVTYEVGNQTYIEFATKSGTLCLSGNGNLECFR